MKLYSAVQHHFCPSLCFRLGIKQTGILGWPRSPSTGRAPSQFARITVTGRYADATVEACMPALGPPSLFTLKKFLRKSVYSWTMKKARCPSTTQRQRLTFILTAGSLSLSRCIRTLTPAYMTTGRTWPSWLSARSRLGSL